MSKSVMLRRQKICNPVKERQFYRTMADKELRKRGDLAIEDEGQRDHPVQYWSGDIPKDLKLLAFWSKSPAG
jgi:hypothetical protein